MPFFCLEGTHSLTHLLTTYLLSITRHQQGFEDREVEDTIRSFNQDLRVNLPFNFPYLSFAYKKFKMSMETRDQLPTLPFKLSWRDALSWNRPQPPCSSLQCGGSTMPCAPLAPRTYFCNIVMWSCNSWLEFFPLGWEPPEIKGLTVSPQV